MRAEHFQVGNADHLLLLKDMGITVVQTADGKVQLMHQAGTVWAFSIDLFNYYHSRYMKDSMELETPEN